MILNTKMLSILREISKELKNTEHTYGIYTPEYNDKYHHLLRSNENHNDYNNIVKLYEPIDNPIDYIEFTKRYLIHTINQNSYSHIYIDNIVKIGFDCWNIIAEYLSINDFGSLMATNLSFLLLFRGSGLRYKNNKLYVKKNYSIDTSIYNNNYINKIPYVLTHLTINNLNDLELYKSNKSSSLTHLTFGYKFNHPVEELILPQSLTHLTFGSRFNQPVNNIHLPSSLTHLKFGQDFNRPVEELILPSSLTHLEFGACFNQPVYDLQLPSSLIHLKFGIWFHQPVAHLQSTNR